MDEALRFVDACTDEHFRAMSLIHALGWREFPFRLRRTGTPLDFICSGEMNSPCAKILPSAKYLYAPLGAEYPAIPCVEGLPWNN